MPAEAVVASRPGSAGGTWQVPFNVVDEVVHLLDSETAPWSVQLEVRVAGSLDESRLRAAFGQALLRHPMARARKLPSPPTRHRHTWEIPPVPDLDPLRVVDCPDEASLHAARAALHSLAVPLVESPPLRAVLARHRDGDVVMVNCNHAATDGFGALRIVTSVARAYRGAADPLPELDLLVERDLAARQAAPDRTARLRRYLALAEKLRDVVDPPARIVAEQAGDAPGYGFHHVALDVDDTRRAVGLDHPGTVNDVLLAALHLAVADWNRRHGARCRRVTVLVPSNLRPPQWRQQLVGNFSLPARISTAAHHRATPTTALRTVTGQTARKKRSRLGTGVLELLARSHHLPLWAKEVLVSAVTLVGDRFVDTALLSNLGRVDPPSFGDEAGETVELWFSAPARMPLGVTVGVVTARGRLHLVFRYRHRQFGPQAAARFADCYLGHLSLLVGSGGG